MSQWHDGGTEMSYHSAGITPYKRGFIEKSLWDYLFYSNSKWNHTYYSDIWDEDNNCGLTRWKGFVSDPPVTFCPQDLYYLSWTFGSSYTVPLWLHWQQRYSAELKSFLGQIVHLGLCFLLFIFPGLLGVHCSSEVSQSVSQFPMSLTNIWDAFRAQFCRFSAFWNRWSIRSWIKGSL